MIRNVGGLDGEAIAAAVAEALTQYGRPTLVCCKTVIGYGAPKLAGTHAAHGAPLGGGGGWGSAGGEVMKYFGFTAEHVAEVAGGLTASRR